GRKLVRGCDVDEACPTGPSPKLIRVEAVTIDRDGNQTSAGGREDLACGRIVRVLDGDAVAGIDEHARDQIQGLLRSTDDDDVSRVARDAPTRAKILGDGTAKRLIPLRRTIAQEPDRGPTQAACREAPPLKPGEIVHRGKRIAEVVSERRSVGRAWKDLRRPGKPPPEGRQTQCPTRSMLRVPVRLTARQRQPGRHGRARTDATDDVAFGE